MAGPNRLWFTDIAEHAQRRIALPLRHRRRVVEPDRGLDRHQDEVPARMPSLQPRRDLSAPWCGTTVPLPRSPRTMKAATPTRREAALLSAVTAELHPDRAVGGHGRPSPRGGCVASLRLVAESTSDVRQAGRADTAGRSTVSRGRRSTRRSSWALRATMIVERLMSTAPIAGPRVSPAQANTPAARGMATTL